jgi:hypothetical protein
MNDETYLAHWFCTTFASHGHQCDSESLKAEHLASVLQAASADAPRAFLCEFVPRIKICIMYSRRYIQGWGGGGRNAQRDERRPERAGAICAIGSVASG